MVARLSDDELGILIETADHASAQATLEKLHQSLNGSVLVTGSQIYASMSAGVVIDCGVTETSGQLLQDARTALGQARLEGDGHFLNFQPEMRHVATARLELEHDLYEAVAREQFELHYQPKIDLDSGRVLGFEALVRWQHPQRGLLPPLDFIPTAEHIGLILPLGRWVLRKACQQTREWQLKYPAFRNLSVGVNVSGKQLADEGLVGQIIEILADSGLASTCLELEITESVLVTDAPAIASLLGQLRRSKVGLNIDDFGTGHSSLQHLQHLPFNTLKIDRTFVNRLGSKRENTDVTRTIIALARRLNLYIISQGIETAEQLRMLKSFGALSGQGYLFSKPMRAAEAENWLAEGRVCNIEELKAPLGTLPNADVSTVPVGLTAGLILRGRLCVFGGGWRGRCCGRRSRGFLQLEVAGHRG